MKTKQRGGITIFTILSLALVISCLLALWNGARFYEIRRMAKLRSEAAVESGFARYNTALWENYHLLGNQFSKLPGLVTAAARSGYGRKVSGTNLLPMKLEQVEVEGYSLLTDAEGVVYIRAVSSYMSRNILYETAKSIYNQYESIRALLGEYGTDGTEIEDALDSLQEIKKQEQKSHKGIRAAEEGNILETIARLKKTQMLELVIEDVSSLSKLEYRLGEMVSHRTLEEGKGMEIEESDWLDRVLLQQYLLTYLTDYTHQKDDRGLAYELEYLLGGKNNDVENLREVVNQLLLLREAANVAYLLSDVEKSEIAGTLALTLAGASANPVLVEAVRLGIIVAWAFAESVLDVRGLLQNKKIPLIKSKDTWTLSLENLGSIASSHMVAKDCEYGIGYKAYLGVLLLLQDEKQLAMRAMDVQEVTLQKSAGAVALDQLIVAARVKLVYRTIGEKELIVRQTYSYY